MLRRITAGKKAALRVRAQEAHVKGDAAKLRTAHVRGFKCYLRIWFMKRGVHGVLDTDGFSQASIEREYT